MKNLLVLLLLCMSIPGLAQVKKGRELLEAGRYEEAMKPLKRDFYGKEESLEAGVLLAKVYYKLMDYSEALDVMNQIGKSRLEQAEDVRFYADVLIANEDFTGAYLIILENLSKDYSDRTTLLYLEKIGDLLEWDTTAVQSLAKSVPGLNTNNNEFAPYMNPNGELWYVNDVNAVQSVFPAAYNNSNIFLYYRTEIKSKITGAVQKPSMLIKRRAYYYHDGPLSKWEGTNNYALTLKDIDAPIEGGIIGIYFSQMTGTEEDIVPFKYNEKYNTGHPTFTNTGKRMIFTSDRPGGYGQMDLWYCDWENGAWSPPVNMGDIINTPFNELFPTFNYGRLYFSSDRLDQGYGALDLYYSSALFDYERVVNMHAPINSAYDDFALTFQDETDGFFSTNRRSGAGGDDIFAFHYEPAQEVVSQANLQILAANLPAGTKVEIYDIGGKLIASTTTESEGKLMVEELKSNKTYMLKLVGVDLEPKALLIAYDSKGRRYGPFDQTKPGEFLFELLPAEDYLLAAQDNDDISYLQFDLKGRIVTENGARVANVPVTLLDSKGAVVQTVRSSENGDFTFQKVETGSTYELRTEGLEEYHEIDVYGNSGAIVQSLSPVGANSFAYLRQTPPPPGLATAKDPVSEVLGVVPTLSIEIKSEATLYNEADEVLKNTFLDSDGFVRLNNLYPGKAYRLEVPNEELGFNDKLIILNAKGDTAQTVRPFDGQNYFFEYLMFADYSQPQVIAENKSKEPEKTPVYKAKIKDYFPEQREPFILKNLKTGFQDTVYCAPNGTLIFKTLNITDLFELTLLSGTMDSEKVLSIYDENNVMVYQGESKDLRSFSFTLLPYEEYVAAAEENLDISILKLDVGGRFLKPKGIGSIELKVYDARDSLLATSYVTNVGKFAYSGLEADEKYTIIPSPRAEYGPIKVLRSGSNDSLLVEQDRDGKFYLNFAKVGEPTMVVQDSKKQVVVPAGSKFDLPDIFYDFNSFSLRDESFETLKKLAEFIRQNPGIRVEIHSHTDSRGPANYNLLLSQKRADSVLNYLRNKGIDASQIQAVGKGETQLINRCKDGVQCPNSEHAQNRRTEFALQVR